MNVLAIIYLAALAVGILGNGRHYRRRPVYDWTHPITWGMVAASFAALALAVWTVCA